MNAKQAQADRMKRPHPAWSCITVKQAADALTHLCRSFIGKSHGHDGIGMDRPFTNKPCNPMGYRTGLSRSSPCQNQQRPGWMRRGCVLISIKSGKNFATGICLHLHNLTNQKSST
jgi:hypothetical protein